MGRRLQMSSLLSPQITVDKSVGCDHGGGSRLREFLCNINRNTVASDYLFFFVSVDISKRRRRDRYPSWNFPLGYKHMLQRTWSMEHHQCLLVWHVQQKEKAFKTIMLSGDECHCGSIVLYLWCSGGSGKTWCRWPRWRCLQGEASVM